MKDRPWVVVGLVGIVGTLVVALALVAAYWTTTPRYEIVALDGGGAVVLETTSGKTWMLAQEVLPMDTKFHRVPRSNWIRVPDDSKGIQGLIEGKLEELP